MGNECIPWGRKLYLIKMVDKIFSGRISILLKAKSLFLKDTYFNSVLKGLYILDIHFYAPAYSKEDGRALSFIPVCVSLGCVRAITPKPFVLYSWNFTNGFTKLRWWVTNKKDNSRYFSFLNYLPSLKSFEQHYSLYTKITFNIDHTKIKLVS